MEQSDATWPGPEMSYIDLLDESMMDKQKKTEAEHRAGTSKYPRYPLRPSAAGSCERELAFQMMEAAGKEFYDKELMSPETLRLLNFGHTIESHLIYFLKQCEFFEVKYQQQTLGFFDIKSTDAKIAKYIEGSNDLCLISRKHGWNAVVDIKSKKDKFSASYKSSWDETDEKLLSMDSVQTISKSAYWVEDLKSFLKELNDPFFAANFLQLNLYANSSFMKERGIDHGVIMQYNKNDSRLREVRFKPCAELFLSVEDRFRNAAQAADIGRPLDAKAEFMPGSIKCAFCDFKSHCWGNTDVQKEYFKTLPSKYWPKRIEEIPEELQEMLLKYHDNIPVVSTTNKLELDICQFMIDNKIFKVDIGDRVIYEVKTYKHSVSLKRGKL